MGRGVYSGVFDRYAKAPPGKTPRRFRKICLICFNHHGGHIHSFYQGAAAVSADEFFGFNIWIKGVNLKEGTAYVLKIKTGYRQ